MNDGLSELDKRILGEAYSSKDTMETVTTLCDEYGSRWPGSGDDKKACEYMAEKLKSFGLKNVHLEKFSHPGWIRGSSSLTVLEPKKKMIECIALPVSGEGVVEADLIYLGAGPIEVYEEKKDEIEGKVVMVNSGNPPGMTRYLHRSEKYQRSIMAGALGWIFMNHYPAYGPPTGGVSPIIPAIGVSYEDGMYLARQLKRKGRVKVRINSKCRNLKVETYNVIADLKGPSNTDEWVIYGAHYEGHDIADGALDDATGAAVVIEIARILAKEKDQLKRNLRFILFGAEEIGLHGSRAYTNQHTDDMPNVRFMLNFDAAGRAGRQGFCLHGWPKLEPFFNEIIDVIGADLPLYSRVGPYSDHWPFLLHGIPTATMGDPEEAKRRGGRGFGHTKYDTVDKANLRAQREAVANASLAAVRLLNSDDWPVVHRTKEEVDELVKTQGIEDTVKLISRLKAYLKSKMNQLSPDAVEYVKGLSGDWDEVI
jgi:Iap family predicted aminopeptidase